MSVLRCVDCGIDRDPTGCLHTAADCRDALKHALCEVTQERDAVLTEALCARDLRKLLDECEGDRDAARFFRAGWRRLAEDKRIDARAWMMVQQEAARDRDAARAECERMRGVVEAAHHITRSHDLSCVGPPCTCGLDALIDALRALVPLIADSRG